MQLEKKNLQKIINHISQMNLPPKAGALIRLLHAAATTVIKRGNPSDQQETAEKQTRQDTVVDTSRKRANTFRE